MKTHTSGFKDALRTIGRRMHSIVTYGNTTLEDELYSVTPVFEANILKSVMKQLDIESSVDIPLDTVINYQLGIKVGNDYEYLDYGNYVVYSSEKQEDTKLYKITCYDKMLYSMKKNDNLGVAYPITIKNYLNALATKIGLTVKDTNFYNADIQIPSELYYGLEYTYRDILDEIAQATGSIIIINADDQLEVKYPTITGDTIDEKFIKDVNVNFGEKFGPINAVVLSRSADSDRINIRDEQSIIENGLCDIKIENNQLMNGNNRSEYLQGLLNALDGTYYYINDFESIGVLYYEPYDIYNVSIGEETYRCLMLNDEINVTTGLKEIIHTEKPEQTETDYSKSDKTDMRLNQTYLIVDKQNQTIESVVSNVTTQNNRIASIQQTVDELNSKISDIADITVAQETMTGVLYFTDINESEPIHIEIYPTGENITYLYPFSTQYVANDKYIKLRKIKFTNTDTNEVFTYELPGDLLYYSDAIRDSFVLDYDSQTVYINKKCGYDSNGNVIVLQQEETLSFSFPEIYLTDGDYTVEFLKYDNTRYSAYFMVRLMSQNIYTSQFATKAEMTTNIQQSATEINSSVDYKLTAYPTTTQMNSAINQKADEITSTVSATYATQDDLSTAQSQIRQTTDSISSTVSTKVGKSEVISSINQSSEAVTINANKISLAGKTINMTSDNIAINSTNFTVDKNGNMSCSNATINNGQIIIKDLATGAIKFRIENQNNSNQKLYATSSKLTVVSSTGASGEIGPALLFISMPNSSSSAFSVLNGETFARDLKYIEIGPYSLKEMKKNIKPINKNTLDIIKNSNIYTFNYNGENDDKKEHIGFIIGEGYKTPKEVLAKDKKSIDITNMCSIMWKAIQEQQEQIEQLQKEIKELKEEK